MQGNKLTSKTIVVHLGLHVCLCIHNTQFSIMHYVQFSIIHKAVNFYAFFIRSLDRGRWQYSQALHRDSLQKKKLLSLWVENNRDLRSSGILRSVQC